MEPVRIGVVGTGSVGSTLGRRWAEAGHAVRFGTRDPERSDVRDLVAGIEGDAEAVTVEGAADADVLVLAVPAAAVESTLSGLDFAGVLVDPTNSYPEAGPEPGAERAARLAPDARVVKAFNTVGWEVMADPDLDGVAATMPLAGDDADAKELVAGLARDLGFEPLDVGDRAAAVHLENLARLWIHLAVSTGNREFAFVRRAR
ncbi:MAG: NAD(P)-binding domain-containing protein [Haloarculaceae archaeon]